MQNDLHTIKHSTKKIQIDRNLQKKAENATARKKLYEKG